MDDEGVANTPGQPSLQGSINVACDENVPCCYIGINFYFHQVTQLARDSNIWSYSPTWQAGKTGLSAPPEVMDAVRDVVADIVDAFINSYLAANPK